jgi:hypothetical protein
MRKRVSALLPVVAGVIVLSACVSGPSPGTVTSSGEAAPQKTGTGPGSGDAAPQKTDDIKRVRVDYKGAATGSAIPEWVDAAIADDYQRIMELPQFKGKIPIVDYGVGQNLDLLRSWVNNFSIQAAMSRRISNHIITAFGGEQLGSKDTPENRSLIQEVTATFSRTNIHGLAKEMDYWVKLRTIDLGKGTETEQYYYYVVYSISKEDLDNQIGQVMGKITAATQEQQELKEDVEKAIYEAALSSIEASE